MDQFSFVRRDDAWDPDDVPVAGMTIHGLFERQVAAAPDVSAVIAGRETLTYRQLSTRVNRLARVLITAGAGPESVMGVALSRSADLVVALLAVLKAGGGYLPIDPA